MSFSLNSRIVDLVAPSARGLVSAGRRRLVMASAALPFAVWGNTDPLAGLQPWGRGEFRRFGFFVYEARLWAGDDPQRPPLALRLEYKRSLKGRAIAEASVKEMRQLGADEARLSGWLEQMTALFPDVKEGDNILGVHLPDRAQFFYNGQRLGEVVDVAFARYFFGIWLDPKTSAPQLRTALLQRSGA